MDYVDNKKLYNEMTKYYEARKKDEEEGLTDTPIPKYVTSSIMLMSNNISKRSNFVGYSYRDEMIQDGILTCIMYGVKSFNPHKNTNPFGYFSMIIFRAFIRRIELEKKQQYIKYKNYTRLMIMDDLEGEGGMGPEHTDVINSVISSYEKKMEEKRKKN